MYHDLEPGAGDGREEVVELLEAQVIRGRHPHRPATLEQVDRQLVGGVEREVGHERDVAIGAVEQSAGVADEESVGPLLSEVMEDVRLERLLDPGGCDERGGARLSGEGNGPAISLDVLELEIEGRAPRLEGRDELLGGATEGRERRARGGRLATPAPSEKGEEGGEDRPVGQLARTPQGGGRVEPSDEV